MAILEVENLSVSFNQYKMFRSVKSKVISSLSIAVDEGEIVAVVGASGSGKSLLAQAILGILPPNATIDGIMLFRGETLTLARQKALRGREIAIIPQSVNSLDPLMRAGSHVRTSVTAGNASDLQKEVFKRYHLEEKVEKLYPFQLSGGMARRVLLASAMVSGAKVIIADEPTPGLDEQYVAEALQHLREFADNGCGVLLITHDIGAALKIADKIAVFYAGTTVEIASIENFRGDGEDLRHPFSKALWRALPENGFEPIPGSQPQPDKLPSGCLFAARCKKAAAACSAAFPEMRELRNGRVRCIHAT
ncbi:oligopeptide/dipeptide ABC transporter ATP-binding protein [Bacillus massilinigeriensis]|uniref:oligopeptide/dipeptide ABC transporter ATP-binding protein n=1 Tax=Bacillus mediterraneensis TaxID=1805474 RepID=UPI0008F848C9|nr:ABC transporter ATP-binding protein [Bacillus mediterraneensis]